MNSPEDSPNPARVAAAKAYHERRKRKKDAEAETPQDEWNQLVDRKVVTMTRKGDRTYSVYLCTRKEADARGIEYKK